MKFGETFMEYLQGDETGILVKCAHVEYKRLKKVLKNCRSQGPASAFCKNEQQKDEGNYELSPALSQFCQYESCPCKFSFLHMFFLESCKLDMRFLSNWKTSGWQLSAEYIVFCAQLWCTEIKAEYGSCKC